VGAAVGAGCEEGEDRVMTRRGRWSTYDGIPWGPPWAWQSGQELGRARGRAVEGLVGIRDRSRPAHRPGHVQRITYSCIVRWVWTIHTPSARVWGRQWGQATARPGTTETG
jgi:hypothetical protein